MKSIYQQQAVVILLSAVIIACGGEVKMSQSSSSRPLSLQQDNFFSGKDDNGQPCSLKIAADGSLSVVELKGKFKVDYKIPTVASGLYGVYYWEGTFSKKDNVIGEVTLGTSPFQKKAILTARGKPIFWDGDAANHRLEFIPSLANPTQVNYHSTDNVVGIIPAVVIDLRCHL